MQVFGSHISVDFEQSLKQSLTVDNSRRLVQKQPPIILNGLSVTDVMY